MSEELKVSLFNFTGVTIDNLRFGGQVVADGNVQSGSIILEPNTPDTPMVLTGGDDNFQSYQLQLLYTSSNKTVVTYAVPLDVAAGNLSVYFVNNNGINYLSLLPGGGVISPYLYSNGYNTSVTYIAHAKQYAAADSYDFGTSPVISVPANRNIKDLKMVDTIDWTDDGSSYWWILLVIAVIVIILIVIAVIGVAVYKSRTKDTVLITDQPTLSPEYPMYL